MTTPTTDPTGPADATLVAAVGRGLTRRRRGAPTARHRASPAGAGLLDEAESLVQLGRDKRALEVFDVARSVIDDPVRHRAVTARMIVVAADANRLRQAERLTRELREIDASDLGATEWHALAVFEAKLGRFDRADTCAREAIDKDPGAPEPWTALATSFAGLGWFDEAKQCLDAAERRALDRDLDRRAAEAAGDEPATHERSDTGAVDGVAGEIRTARTEVAMARLGRAINDWSLRQTHTTTIAIVGVLFFNLIGLAIALTTPFVVRGTRIARLEAPFDQAAKQDWLGRHGLRLGRALAVLILVLTWVVLTGSAGTNPPN